MKNLLLCLALSLLIVSPAIGGEVTAVPMGMVAVETDPIVGAVTGIIEADGGGNISAATEGTDYYAPGGTDVADADVVDTITITNISQVQDITASAAEINTIDDCATTELFVGGGAGSAIINRINLCR